MEVDENDAQPLSTTSNPTDKFNENHFRVPKVPKKKKDSTKSPLKDRNADENMSKLSLSPGTLATEDRKAAMIKKLEKRRSNNATKWKQQRAEQSTKCPQIDLGETEKSFIEQNIPGPPRLSIADLSMINPSDSFVLATPRKQNSGPLCSTPFAAKTAVSKPKKSVNETVTVTMANQSIYESQEDISERQFLALSLWCNMLLNTCNRFEDGIADLGKTKQEASKQLQDLLSKPGKEPVPKEAKKFCYKDFLRKQEFDKIRAKARQVYTANEFPQKIASLVQNQFLTIRDGRNVYSDLLLKTNLLRVFLSFHPVWLHLGMEIVFGTTILIPDGASFLSVISRFINASLFTDAEIMKQKKYAIGSVKMLVTPEGRLALHRHFLVKTCQFLYCVEMCKTSGIIPSDPRLFARKSQFKSLNDVFSELSRELLSATSLTLGKAFARIGFQPKYKQNYFDDLEYKVEKISDLVDGVNFGKLVEVACSLGRGTVMSRLRDPKGDRLRKIGNVTVVLEMASKAGVDVGKIKPEAIVAANRETILEILWRIIGVFVLASSGNSEELRRESLRLQIDSSGRLVAEQTASPEDYVLQICRHFGVTFGITVNSINELRDGILLSMIWREYNSGADDVHFYKGSTLFKKVVNAAETELDVPVGLHGSLPLFVHLYLTRIFHCHRLNEAARTVQAAWRRSRRTILKRLKEFLRSEQAEQLRRTRAGTIIPSLLREDLQSVEETFIVRKEAPHETTIVEDLQVTLVDNSQEFHENAHFERFNLEEELSKTLEPSLTQQNMDTTLLENYQEDKEKENFEPFNLEEELSKTLESSLTQQNKETILLEKYETDEESVHFEPFNLEEELHKSLEPSSLTQQNTTGNESLNETIQRVLGEIDQQKMREDAAVVVQKHLRGFLARMKYKFMKDDALRRARERQEELERKIILVQSVARGFLTRKQYFKSLRSIVSVQSSIRAYLARKKLISLKEETTRKGFEKKVIMVQSVARGFLARKQYIDTLKSVSLVQKSIRSYLARKKLISLKEEAARKEFERKIIFIQTLFKCYIAVNKFMKLQKERKERKETERKVVVVQRYVRGFLARIRINEVTKKEVSDLERQIQEASASPVANTAVQIVSSPALRKSVLSMQRTPSTPELLRTLRRLRHEIGLVKACNATYEKTLNNLKCVGKKPTVQEKTHAACLIQRLWRGFRARKENASKIGHIREAMERYRDDVNKLEMALDRLEESRPAHQRLAEWSEMLFGASLYKMKVAAVSILRVINLSTCLCRHFVVKCEGLAAVLDRIEQTDRSPGEEEVVTALTAVLARIIQEASTDSAVKEIVLKFAQDCLKNLFHIFHAFYNSRSNVVPSSVSGLVGLKKLSSEIRFEKAGYYISQAEKRFHRLPEGDPKKMSLRLLSQYLQ